MAATESRTVVGVFADQTSAAAAVQDLRRVGFGADEIGYVHRSGDSTASEMRPRDPTELGQETGTRAEERAISGAFTGGALGGLLGAAAALMVPVIGQVVAGGLLTAVIAGALGGGAAGAAAGGIVGALVGLGVPEEDARGLQRDVEAGRTVVIVRAARQSELAADILARHRDQT